MPRSVWCGFDQVHILTSPKRLENGILKLNGFYDLIWCAMRLEIRRSCPDSGRQPFGLRFQLMPPVPPPHKRAVLRLVPYKAPKAVDTSQQRKAGGAIPVVTNYPYPGLKPKGLAVLPAPPTPKYSRDTGKHPRDRSSDPAPIAKVGCILFL